MALSKVAPGEKFRPKASDWNAFVDAANYVRGRMADQNVRKDRPPEDAVPFKNAASSDMPQYGVGWLNDAAFQGLSLVGQPAYPCISRIIIASKPVAAGALGAGWTHGLRPVRVDHWDSLTVGQKIGAQAGSWLAGADPLGPMLVVGKLDSPLVVALITGERGGCKMIRTGPGATDGRPVRVLIFSSRFTLRQSAPGDVTVSGGRS